MLSVLNKIFKISRKIIKMNPRIRNPIIGISISSQIKISKIRTKEWTKRIQINKTRMELVVNTIIIMTLEEKKNSKNKILGTIRKIKRYTRRSTCVMIRLNWSTIKRIISKLSFYLAKPIKLTKKTSTNLTLRFAI